MPLLNYTTEVPVNRSIGHVHALLVEAGARQIMATYDNVGNPIGISFSIETANGTRLFTLPVRSERVRAVLAKDPKTKNTKFNNPQQAERVAWRIAKDWLEAQLALVATEMVTFEQVMLPYMQAKGGKTVYELYLADQLPALESG